MRACRFIIKIYHLTKIFSNSYKKTAEKLSRKNKQNKILPLQLFKSVIKSATKKQQGEGNITQVIIHLVHWKNFPKNVPVRIRG